jgi:hypothetical protein
MTQEEIQRRNELIASMLFGIYSEIANAWGFGNARIVVFNRHHLRIIYQPLC